MYSHLVSIEVGVKSCTNERMDLDSIAFYQDRPESLDA
jgi:hypothetical protein